MAAFFQAKAPTEVVERRWLVPVNDDDGPLSASLSASGVTIDADSIEGDELVLTLSAGAAGATGSITATITTSRGETLVETLYIPIVGTASSSATVLDIASFALRKIYGVGETLPADAAEHAVECLSDMLKEWAKSGADVGATFPLETVTVIYAPESYLRAIKNNLIVEASEVFDREVTETVVRNANRGLQHIKQSNLSGDRSAVYY